MASQDLIDHYKLNVDFLVDHCQELSYGRRKKAEKKWYRVKSIGRGGYGTVWLEQDRQTSLERAVKEIPKKTSIHGPRIDYTKELLAMAKFSRYQDSFVQFYGWYENVDTVFLAMEYFEHRDLSNFIGTPLPEIEVQSIVTQLLEGLVILHENKFTHRDLKPQNVFVVEASPNWWVKIGDFGISKRIETDSTALRTQAGTRHFQAPEVLGLTEESDDSLEYTNAVDIWSLGCLSYAILTSRVPFSEFRSLIQFCQRMMQFPTKELEDNGVSQVGVAFLKELMEPKASDRPNAETALRSEWFKAPVLHNVEKGQTPSAIPTYSLEKMALNGRSDVSSMHPSDSALSYQQLTPVSESQDLSVIDGNSRSAGSATTSGSSPRASILSESGAGIEAKTKREPTPSNPTITDAKVEISTKESGIKGSEKVEEDIKAFTTTTKDDITPLHIAAHDGDHAAVQLLVDEGTQQNAKTKQKATSLHLAAQEGHEAIVRLLLSRTPPLEAQTDFGYTALHSAAKNNHASIVKMLLDHGSNIEARDKRQWTPLHLAAQDGSIEAMQSLLAMGVDKEAKTNEKDSSLCPLHLAAYHGHVAAVQLLIDSGADKAALSKAGATALHFAAQEGHDDVIEILLANLLSVHCRTERGFTPLHLAAETGHVSAMNTLLKHGADINSREHLGYTPLHSAAEQGHTAGLKYLLAAGADDKAEKSDGLKALDVASYKGHLEAVELLLGDRMLPQPPPDSLLNE